MRRRYSQWPVSRYQRSVKNQLRALGDGTIHPWKIPSQTPHDTSHTQAVLLGGGGGEDWGHLSQPRWHVIPTTHRRCYGGRGEDLGHLSQARRPMLPTTHRRCYGGRGEDLGHLSQARHPMLPTTHRRSYWGGVKIRDTFTNPGAPWYRPHTGGAMGGVVKIEDTFPKPGAPCYQPHTGGAMGGGVKIWDTFLKPGIPCYQPHTGVAIGEGWRLGTPLPTQVPHDTGHTQAVLYGGWGEDKGHLSQPRCPMIPATQRQCYMGGGVKIRDTFPNPGAPWYQPHTGGAMGNLSQARGIWRLGTPFPTQVPHDTGHTQAVLWETFLKPGSPCYRPHTGGAIGGGGWRLGTPFPSQASHITGHTQAVL